MRLSEEASDIYNHSQKVKELGSVHRLGGSPAFVPWSPFLISPSGFALRFISVVSHQCSRMCLY